MQITDRILEYSICGFVYIYIGFRANSITGLDMLSQRFILQCWFDVVGNILSVDLSAYMQCFTDFSFNFT